MKVCLEKGLWIGESQETQKEEDAKEFDSIEEALEALERAREFKDYLNATLNEDVF